MGDGNGKIPFIANPDRILIRAKDIGLLLMVGIILLKGCGPLYEQHIRAEGTLERVVEDTGILRTRVDRNEKMIIVIGENVKATKELVMEIRQTLSRSD